LGAAEQLDALLMQATGVGPGRSLAAKVGVARAALEPDHSVFSAQSFRALRGIGRGVTVACGVLQALINEVHAQAGPTTHDGPDHWDHLDGSPHPCCLGVRSLPWVPDRCRHRQGVSSPEDAES